ncbi:PBS lyase HEAT domain protein repeat-containing protein [Planctopirus limnophila DSM 3776]|uniref:PBS lyase HEAT domain protein repeat-containing protein n=1 Tax=Planctopirus limnophila (strain ATCC 43296 / DSM 3776 / IFAM 1008 / Mu 290) TaxID=521674 RepID=D5SR76_PLAL2|nr:DUF4375 domain-containing protein [Planctopirus limnophila]ADG68569.1 PBS lyase HEAT domain protein repeat-containing protein [Planctopirus limnophila DSM 3776]
MKYAAFILGIVVIISIGTFITYRMLRPRHGENGGFSDWLKNPDYKQAAADYFAARKALTIPDDISDEEIQKMVDQLFDEKDKHFNFDRLQLVGMKAVPMLINALNNPKTASMKFGDGGYVPGPASPFERIADLLESSGSPQAAQPLAKYMQHNDSYFRKYAAHALGNIGTSECIEPMLIALGDDDDYVRSFAMMGVEGGIRAKRCTPEFLDAMVPALTKLLDRPDNSVSGRAPGLLLAIDTNRAMSILLSSDYFSIENKQLQYIIRALNTAGHKIPHDTLLPLLKTLKPLVADYPHDYNYSEALIAYANHPDASAEELFRLELTSGNEKIQRAAAEALAILSGVTNAREVIFDALDKQGFDQLSSPQKHYYAVFMYDSEVCNGGHSQYFVNSSGDHWKSALAGLKAIGAEKRALILQEATKLFGTAGPAVDNDTRHRQLAAFTSKKDQVVDGLDTRYYECSENVEALLALYAIKHKEHFVVPD